jgi:hypothetical protein
MQNSFLMLGTGLLLCLSLARAAEPDVGDRSKVLGLVSLEYQLLGRDHPRNHDLQPYKPLFGSKEPGVAEVAKSSVLWELAAIRPAIADQEFQAKVEEFLGVDASGRPNLGAIRRFIEDDFMAKSFNDIIQTQNDRYKSHLRLAEMQDKLWDRAEALAKERAGKGELDPKVIDISFGPKKGVGWTIVVRNRSKEPIPCLTLTATAKRTPLPPGNPGGDLFLGALTAAITGEEDAGKVAKSGAEFQESVANYRKLQEHPVRIFAHVPTLPAGGVWEVMLLRSTQDLVHCESATFSLWGDGQSVEGKPVPRFESQVIQSRKKMEDDAKKAAKTKTMPPKAMKGPPKRPPRR